MLARRLIAASLIAASAAAAAALSAHPTAVPASPWITAGGVGLAALALLAPEDRRSAWRLLLPAALVLLSAVACQVHLRHGFPRTHDARLHLWSLYTINRCILDGCLVPRWNPYMGLGYPLLQFYPPVSYLAVQPLMLLGASPVTAGAALVLISSALSGLSASWAARRLGCGRAAQLVAGAALVLAPYHLHDANYRYALAELAAFPLIPPFWILGRQLALGPGRATSAHWFVAVAAALLLTHLLTAMMLGLLLGLWVVVEVALRRGGGAAGAAAGLLGGVGGACLAAGALVAPFLVPALGEVDRTNVARFVAGPGHPLSAAGIRAQDLVLRWGWSGYHHSRHGAADADPQALIPYYVGLVLLALCAAAVVLAAGGRRRELRTPAATTGALAAVAAAALALSCGVPAFLLDHLPGLGALQFPWRFLGPASAACALGAGVAVEHLAPAGRGRALAAAGALALLAADAYPYLGAPDWHEPHRGCVHYEFVGPGATYAEQYDPVDARLPRGEFVRVQWLRFPPSEPGWRVAQAHRSHREYMTPRLYRDYVLRGTDRNDLRVAARFGVRRHFSSTAGATVDLDAAPLASFTPHGGRPVPAAHLRVRPERLTVGLPPGHDGGRVRVLFQAFPGWTARVDGGRWEAALDDDGLLACDVGPGAREVELQYSWSTPARRGGLVCGIAAWGGLALLSWVRHRWRTAAA